MTYKETNQLIERYLDGLATPEEEHRLALEVAKADAPDEWKIIAAMLGELTTDEAIYDQMMAERECSANTVKPMRRAVPWHYIAAAACVIIALSVSIVLFVGKDTDKQPELFTTIAPPSKPDTIIQEIPAPVTPVPEPKYIAASRPEHAKPDVKAKEVNTPKAELLAKQEPPQPTDAKQTDEESQPKLFPITNPKRLEYTEEEKELLRQRAKEKYQEWIELERQIIEMEQKEMAELTDSYDDE